MVKLSGMFIRRTKTRTTANGESHYSHRLVRSERVGAKVRQRRTLHVRKATKAEPNQLRIYNA